MLYHCLRFAKSNMHRIGPWAKIELSGRTILRQAFFRDSSPMLTAEEVEFILILQYAAILTVVTTAFSAAALSETADMG